MLGVFLTEIELGNKALSLLSLIVLLMSAFSVSMAMKLRQSISKFVSKKRIHS
ncbi:hypothetical protein VCJ_002965 [Vibrio metoecus]|nr:hypothetical protein VCJ_002965 [Vibrio metoecus]